MDSEIQDKNDVLKDFVKCLKSELQDLKKETLDSRTLYANTLKTTNVRVSHISPLIVKAKQEKDKYLSRKTVINEITNDIDVPVDTLQQTKNGKVVIECTNSTHTHKITLKIESELHEKIGNDYDIYTEDLTEARIKIVGMENKYELEELERNIVTKTLTIPNIFAKCYTCARILAETYIVQLSQYRLTPKSTSQKPGIHVHWTSAFSCFRGPETQSL